ncbi:MAG: hypothetical protein KC620_26215, partial [Myxococcales bacterium]|nr:hypothetical protein [Myxococcales bacterium]
AGTVGASYAIFDWLVPFGRAELSTETVAGTDRGATQYVAGLEFFPLPYVELRPEYRIVKTDAFLFGQPAVQLHLFY